MKCSRLCHKCGAPPMYYRSPRTGKATVRGLCRLCYESDMRTHGTADIVDRDRGVGMYRNEDGEDRFHEGDVIHRLGGSII